MRSTINYATASSAGPNVARRIEAALAILLEAYDYAQDLQRSVWDFAVENHLLVAAGSTHSDLRWLVCRAFLDHAAEKKRSGQNSRVFTRTGALTFTSQTCFVLTETGAALARQGSDSAGPSIDRLGSPFKAGFARRVPQWDRERQELRLGAMVVKQFKVPAPNQETILAVFQEEGWPSRIDDPLPPQPDQVAKRRLHDTIMTLNRHHRHRLIRFSGDGSGLGVRWKFLFPPIDQDAAI